VENLSHIFVNLRRRFVPSGVGRLAGANLVSQLCALVTIPLLTRWCNLADFGLLQIYLTITTLGGSVACLRYDYALLQPEDNSTAARLGLLSFLAALGSGFLAIAIVPVLSHSFKTEGWLELAHFAPTVGFTVAIAGMSSAANQWLVRIGRFHNIAQARVAQSMTVSALQLSGAVIGLGGTGLILGDAVGRFAGLIILLRCSGLFKGLPRERAGLNRLFHLGKRYIRFPAIATPSALINAIGFSLPSFIIERFFGTSGLGVFSLLERVMGIPTLFVGQPLSQTFIHRLRQAIPCGPVAAQTEIRETARKAAILGLVPFVALALFGPVLFSFVFGERWRITGELAQRLALPYYVAYALWPVMPTVYILNRLRTQMIWDVCRAAILMCFVWLGGLNALRLNGMISAIVVVMSSFGVIHYLLCQTAAGRIDQSVPVSQEAGCTK